MPDGGTRTSPRRPLPRLTLRQEEALLLAGDGLTDAEIGQGLGISARGAAWHMEQLRGLFGVGHKRELVRCARRYFGR